MIFIIVPITVFLLWLLYLEYSPQIGGIVFRYDSSGTLRFSPSSIVTMLLEPFKSIKFWYPQFWDLNIYILISISLLILYFFCG